MTGRWRIYLTGAVMLLTLASCGRSFLQTGERESWRHQAEVTCLQSGAVKMGAGVVQISPIEGPGMCGADFPLKVGALGESPALGYADELRPPGSIPNGSPAQMPNWPPNQPRYMPPQPVQVQPVQTRPAQGQTLRWQPGAPAIQAPEVTQPADRPVSL
ncbi:MAG: extensin, partial [Pseudolabrys sp.]